jgi:hypothetical protein
MKSRTSSTVATACLFALLAAGVLVFLDKPAVVANDKEKSEKFEFGAQIEHPFGEKSVKGAPFSAQVVFENTQTLANGVHLARKMIGALYRDSEGRTRNELPREGSPEMVLINDGVAGVFYHMNLLQHSAVKVDVGRLRTNREHEERRHQLEHQEREEARTINREQEEREHAEKATGLALKRSSNEAQPERRVESLGVQTFEGVQVEVTRFTVTIPTGLEGNDKPFDVVSERWYSPELQVVVMGKRSDPRTGEVLYRLTNINRSEPARSLFEAPADFTVKAESMELRRKERQ